MLFNSYPFILFFLLVFLVYYLLNPNWRYYCLLFSGAIFFGSIFNFSVFLVSVITNGIAAYYLEHIRENKKQTKYTFVFFVFLNIAFLFYFKYFYEGIIPLAISFYTFEQITYLSSIAFSQENEPVKFSLRNYLIFIFFFPRLLAGPIYYYKEYKDSFQELLTQTVPWEKISRGLPIFCLGLFKKVICAAQMALIVDPFYESPAAFSTLDTWFSSLAYSLQIYFDFSAYSEMALGIGMMFGIILPLNFNSPYKATSIIDFWSRWHMSLSRFIKEYVYIPLGGNKAHQLPNIIFTMSLAGAWHGSGLNFLAWGGLHGIFIAINHLLRRHGMFLKLPTLIKIIFTFFLINTTWILFRSSSLADAFVILKQYIGHSSETTFHFKESHIRTVFVLAFIVFLFPNINEIFLKNSYINFKRNIIWGSLYVLAFLFAYTKMEQNTSFIYFNF